MTRWIQENVALARREGRLLWSARALFRALEPWLAEHEASGTLVGFFFMRKPPGVRLRFAFTGRAARAERERAVILADLVRRRSIRRVTRVVYEPEERLFGGPAAMELAHAHFSADTRAFLAHDRLEAAAEVEVEAEVEAEADAPRSVRASAPVLCFAAIGDLIAETIEDRTEVWDTWSNLALLVPPLAEAPVPRAPPSLAALGERVGREERRVLELLGRGAETYARGLRAAWSTGQVDQGLRKVVPFVAWFQLGRWGIAPELQARIVRGAAAALDPRLEMR